MAAIALMVGATMVACSKDEVAGIEPEPDSDFYTVKIGWEGEIIDVTYEPLDTRATTDDLYGIQVYSTPDKELAEGESATWTAYAYGLFDDPDNISINLLKGYKYKFVATMVRDGKNRINHTSKGYYMYPFNIKGSDSGLFKNIFDYQGSTQLNGLGNGRTTTTEGGYFRPNTDRFYGELVDYTPGDKNATAKINMKRTAFGAKFIAKGAKAKEGTLHVQMTGAPAMELALTTSENKISDIFTFSNVAAAWADNKYTETIDVTINWKRADGTTLPLGTHAITYKRNATTVVNVKIENDGADGGLGFEIDESETGEPIADGENDVTIEDGEVVDTDVDTNGSGGSNEESESANIPNNQIWYTATEKIELDSSADFGTEIKSNEFADGKGIITFNGNVTEIDDEALCGLTTLTSITIPGSVTTIKGNPFYDCPNLSAFYGPLASDDNRCLIIRNVLKAFAPYGLKTYTIPNSVTNIGTDAFANCANLTEVIIPEQVTRIQDYVFWGCTGLSSITIPGSVEAIDTQVFEGCSNLKEVFCKATTPPIIPSDIFHGCSSELKIYVPIESVDDYKTAAEWIKYADKIVADE